MFRPRTLCQMKPAPLDKNNINPHKTSLPYDYFQETPEYEGKPNCQRIPFDKIATAWEKDIYISNYNRMKDNNFKILDK